MSGRLFSCVSHALKALTLNLSATALAFLSVHQADSHESIGGEKQLESLSVPNEQDKTLEFVAVVGPSALEEKTEGLLIPENFLAVKIFRS